MTDYHHSNTMAVSSRSKPIAIKSPNQWFAEDEEEDREQCEKQFYDSATWRMYNRIVDHRLNTPPHQSAAPIYDNASSLCSPNLVHKGSCSPTGLIRPQPRYARPMMMTGLPSSLAFPMINTEEEVVHQEDSSTLLDGEVFELEL